MTVQNPPIFLQGGSHPAEDTRRALEAIIGRGLEGIVQSTDMSVAENGTPNMSVDVAGGQAFIQGTEGTYQAAYFVENRGTTNLTISASDPTNPRIDLVVAKIEDSAYSGATDAWSLAVVTGTPAGSPSAPTAPDNSITLAQVAVAASATSITNANITDTRTSVGRLFHGQVGINETPDSADTLQLIVAGGSDASLSEGTGYLQIGESGGANIAIDNNEIIARDGAGAASNLVINNNGGTVSFGAATDLTEFKVNDDLIYADGATDHVGIGTTSLTSDKLRVEDNSTGGRTLSVVNNNASHTDRVLQVTGESLSGSYNLCQMNSNSGSNLRLKVTSAGVVTADGTFTGGGADYAEFFESATGKAIPNGTLVTLKGDKVVKAKRGDVIVGVVRSQDAAGFIGNSPLSWRGMVERDEFGEIKRDKDGNHVVSKDYDPEREYVDRFAREEWVCVGLLGQLPVRKGQAVPEHWLLLREGDKADTYLVR